MQKQNIKVKIKGYSKFKNNFRFLFKMQRQNGNLDKRLSIYLARSCTELQLFCNLQNAHTLVKTAHIFISICPHSAYPISRLAYLQLFFATMYICSHVLHVLPWIYALVEFSTCLVYLKLDA